MNQTVAHAAAASTGATPATARSLPALDPEADRRFQHLLARNHVGGQECYGSAYVELEWRRSRHLLENLPIELGGAQVLEFGCHIGASAIVLALLGAEVTALDVTPQLLALAEANAERYGVGQRIRFLRVEDSRRLPFRSGEFDLVVCNSVLEYVAPAWLAAVQRELGRVLRRGGLVMISGTSNKLWPREVHSGQWLSNYLPRFVDQLVPAKRIRRGVNPWDLRRGFRGFTDLLAEDPALFLRAKQRMGVGRVKRAILSAASAGLAPLGLSAASFTPNITMVLRKPPGPMERRVGLTTR